MLWGFHATAGSQFRNSFKKSSDRPNPFIKQQNRLIYTDFWWLVRIFSKYFLKYCVIHILNGSTFLQDSMQGLYFIIVLWADCLYKKVSVDSFVQCYLTSNFSSHHLHFLLACHYLSNKLLVRKYWYTLMSSLLIKVPDQLVALI